jgi:hypothetical protein
MKKKYIQIPLSEEEFKIWQDIIAKTMAVRCHYLVKEEKRKVLNKMAKVLKEEIYYDK